MNLKTGLGIAAVYAAVALLIFASDRVPWGYVEDVAVAPMVVSLLLLVPVTGWYRRTRRPGVGGAGRRTRRAAWSDVAVLLSAAMVLRVPFVLAVGMSFEKTPLIYLLALTSVLVLQVPLGAVGFQTAQLRRALLLGLVYFLVYAAAMFATLILTVYVATGHLLFVGHTLLPALLVFPYMTCCVGVSEEGLFRGVIQTRLAQAYTPTYALWAQAVLFGLWHFVWHVAPFNPTGMSIHILSSLAFGWAFGRFFQRAGTLVPLILAHGLVDTVSYGAVLNPQLDPTPLTVQLAYALAFAVGIAALALLTPRLATHARSSARAPNGPDADTYVTDGSAK